MEVIIEQVTSWKRALNAARWTQGLQPIDKEPSDGFKIKSMMSCHSPKRLVEYDIKIKGIPYCNAVHFVRHHVGVEKFQCTLRDDLNNEIDDRRKLPQNYPVNLWIACNAESLLAISYMRLCNRASKETREIWDSVRVAMANHDMLVARFMQPQCIRFGFCPEDPDKCCGFVRTKSYRFALDKYREGFVQ